MRYVGPAARSAGLSIVVVLGLTWLGSSGCGGSAPEPTAEEIKTSRINRVLNEPLQKQIDANAKRKSKGRGRR